jgi:hypothetical protein
MRKIFIILCVLSIAFLACDCNMESTELKTLTGKVGPIGTASGDTSGIFSFLLKGDGDTICFTDTWVWSRDLAIISVLLQMSQDMDKSVTITGRVKVPSSSNVQNAENLFDICTIKFWNGLEFKF